MNQAEWFSLWKDIITVRVSASGQVCLAPCFIFGAHVEASAGGTTIDGHLYDGHNVTDKEKITFTNKEGTGRFLSSTPMFFKKGCYAYLETNIASITIQYLPLRE